MFFLQLIPKIFHTVLNFPKILQLSILFTPVSRGRNLRNTPAAICLLFFFFPAAIWSSIVTANCMFFVIFRRKPEAAIHIFLIGIQVHKLLNLAKSGRFTLSKFYIKFGLRSNSPMVLFSCTKLLVVTFRRVINYVIATDSPQQVKMFTFFIFQIYVSVSQWIFNSWGWNSSRMLTYSPYYPHLAITPLWNATNENHNEPSFLSLYSVHWDLNLEFQMLVALRVITTSEWSRSKLL